MRLWWQSNGSWQFCNKMISGLWLRWKDNIFFSNRISIRYWPYAVQLPNLDLADMIDIEMDGDFWLSISRKFLPAQKKKSCHWCNSGKITKIDREMIKNRNNMKISKIYFLQSFFVSILSITPPIKNLALKDKILYLTYRILHRIPDFKRIYFSRIFILGYIYYFIII